MATNADGEVDNDDKTVTAQDLYDLKYGADEVENSKESDETDKTEESNEEEQSGEEDGQTADQATDESEESDEQDSNDEESGFVKELPNIKGATVEEYARSLEEAYKQSTAEALRLKGLVDGKTADPVSLYVKQKMDDEITTAFNDFQKAYPQAVPGTPEYAAFVSEVATFSETILKSQKRLASPKELYTKAAVSLSWEPGNKVDGQENLKIALKGNGSVSKTSSAIKVPKKSKVTDQMVALNRIMYPNKTDAEIREELEPYVKT